MPAVRVTRPMTIKGFQDSVRSLVPAAALNVSVRVEQIERISQKDDDVRMVSREFVSTIIWDLPDNEGGLLELTVTGICMRDAVQKMRTALREEIARRSGN